MELYVTPAQVQKYLGVKARRLHLWCEAGLLGERIKSVGQGKIRHYIFHEVFVARVLKELMDLTQSRNFKLAKKKELLNSIYEAVTEYVNTPGAILYSDTREEKLRHANSQMTMDVYAKVSERDLDAIISQLPSNIFGGGKMIQNRVSGSL